MINNIPAYFGRRATVRIFDRSRHIGDSTLRDIIALAAQAPNTGNMQLYSVVATRGEELKKELAALHYNQPAAAGADVLLTVCADTRRFAAWCDAREAKSGLDNLGGRLSALVDASIFAQQIVTIAEMGGLGCCYLGTATYNVDGFCNALELPQGVIPVVGIAMGYPVGDIPLPSDRLPVDAILHDEEFTDYTPEQIDSYYAAKEALPESTGFVKMNNKKTLAQVYSDIRYPRDLNDAVGTAMLKHLK